MDIFLNVLILKVRIVPAKKFKNIKWDAASSQELIKHWSTDCEIYFVFSLLLCVKNGEFRIKNRLRCYRGFQE